MATTSGPTWTFPSITSRALTGLVAVFLVIAIVVQVLIWRVDDIWHDELYTLFASNPDLSFGDMVIASVSDTNPPFFYLALGVVRRFWNGPPSALFPLLNLFFLLIVFVLLATDQRRRGLGFAVVACCALLAAGTGHFYLAEGRGYFLASCVAFLVALDAFKVAVGAPPARAWVLFLAGIVASLSHVFSALVAGSVGGALFLYALVYHRREVIPSALALGMGASLGTLAWLGWAWQFVARVDWMEFTVPQVRSDVETVLRLTFGSDIALVLFAQVVVGAALIPKARPMALVLVVSCAFIVVLPILASFIQPVIQARYWMVAAPLVPAFLLSVIWTTPTEEGRFGPGVAWLALGVLLLTSILAGPQAIKMAGGQAYWRGAHAVASEAASCPAGSMRVWLSGRPEFFPDFYSIASGLPADRFVSVGPGQPAPPWPGPDCPIVGWAEHYPDDDPLRNASDPEVAAMLLEQLGIPGDPSQFTIDAHYGFWEGGFVVRRKS